MTVSMVRRCYDTETSPISFDEIWDAIRNGKHGLKGKIQQIRNRYEVEKDITGDPQKAKKAVADLKNELPGFLPSGTFRTRANEALVEYSGYLCADADQLGEKLSLVREAMKAYPFVHAVALSPSGDGLKVFFNVIKDQARHEDSFRAIKQFMLDEGGIAIDEKCRDLARICFFTWDEDLWTRLEGNEPIQPADPLPRVTPPPTSADVNLAIRQQCAIEIAGRYGRNIEWISGSEGFLKPCPNFEAHGNRDGPKDCKVYLLPSEHFNGATFYCVHESCRSVILQMRHELCSLIAKGENSAAFQKTNEVNEKKGHTSFISSISSINGEFEETELTSFTSFVSHKPKNELRPEAYYGLAGKIVDNILPQSESDPVALLFQTLISFGSIAGRFSHIRVGGAYHYMNLFGVLVGPTAKGRKGTSWHDIKFPILYHVDLAWFEAVGNGLASGEGLVQAVRDEVTQQKPVKKEGCISKTMETVVIDPGVTDKRLLVVEPELSRLLQVMRREGNTLSALIRTAWESGILRIMTKSPVRASGAHISILGHITPEELRKWMNEVEAANGFGNRFLWLSVERSKCLPEGNLITGVDDEILAFREAIEFAKRGHVLIRDMEAAESWAEIYPGLSENKDGFCGALTARAEAQVLRLSGIYALMEQSKVIKKPHLDAALALWRYCEDSVNTIFRKGTGNPEADKIYDALCKREKGMTRTEIIDKVFSRNIPRVQIDDALSLLHHLKLAGRSKEESGGRPAERWRKTN